MATTEYQTPGVHVQEVPPAPGPIQGAGTSVAAFVGLTIGGPLPGTVHALTSYRQFVDLFTVDNKLPVYDIGLNLLANGVYGFFDNGGMRCYVTRIENPNDPFSGKDRSWICAQIAERAIAAAGQLLAQYGHSLAAQKKTSLKKKLQDTLENLKSNLPEPPLNFDPTAYQQALWNWLQSQFSEIAPELVADSKKLVKSLVKHWLEELKLDYRAKKIDELNQSGNDIGNGLVALEPYDDISIVAAPGLTGESHWNALITHCAQSTPNCFAILDSPQGEDWAKEAPIYPPAPLPEDPECAAIYYPWIKIRNAGGSDEIIAPPSGHIAGVYARVDTQRGVFKAPANESIFGALDVANRVSDRQQAGLNDGASYESGKGDCGINVNCIRKLNGGILIWGARTIQTDADDQFKYVSTRRTFNYIRQSLEEGMQWAVFEPNTPALWGQIVRNVTSFLTKLWQEGGLFGTTAAEAFYVKCDADTNPESVRDAGQVVTEVGVAITKPAEFVVFKLGLTSGNTAPSSNS